MSVVPQLYQSSAGSSLWNEGYLIARGIVSPPSVNHLYRYILNLASSGRSLPPDEQVPNAPAGYGDAVIDKLLEALQPTVESLSQRLVYPTYSYFRIYKKSDTLARHTDRAACEISLSLSLGFQGENAWPLWVQGFHETVAATLSPGDGVLYLGTKCPHWRESFDGESAVQVFLHYVDRNGRFRDWKFDKRPALAHHGGIQVLNSNYPAAVEKSSTDPK